MRESPSVRKGETLKTRVTHDSPTQPRTGGIIGEPKRAPRQIISDPAPYGLGGREIVKTFVSTNKPPAVLPRAMGRTAGGNQLLQKSEIESRPPSPYDLRESERSQNLYQNQPS